MGSLVQSRWAQTLIAVPRQRSAPETGTASITAPRPDLRKLAILTVAAWILVVVANALRTDIVVLLVIVYATGGLLRIGGTVVDRLMITVGLLAGTAIAAGVLFSLWPFGLDPRAVGGVALTVLVVLRTWTGRRVRWPRRVLGSDAILLTAAAAGTYVAYGPARLGKSTHQLAYAALTGDRLRHFSLFDTIHRVGGYTFLLQGKSRHLVDPGMIALYPPGQHYLYALFDIFLTSHTNPGNPVSELLRYNLYACAGYGFFVLCVAWAARWVAGPALAGWRRAVLTATIAVFLGTGVMTTAIWCGWDPQIFGMGLLALLAACAFRPPTGPRTYVLMLAALTVGVFLTYDLFAPFAAMIVVVSAVVYRDRWLPRRRFAAITAAVAIPIAAAEIVAAQLAGLHSAQAALTAGFTVAMTKESLAVLALLGVAGFAVRRARRRPSAVAALAGTVLCGGGVLAFWAYQHSTIGTTTYYYEKAVQAWVVVALVGVGTVGHLLRVPKIRVPERGLAGATVGCCALLAAVLATDSVAYGPLAFDYSKMKPGSHTSWARVWMSGKYIYPVTQFALSELRGQHLLGDGKPTLVLWDDYAEGDVNLSLTLAVLNHDAGLISNPVYGLINVPNLATAGEGGPWTAQQTASLQTLEQLIVASPVPLRVVVSSTPLAQRLNSWAAANPSSRISVLLLPNLPGEATP
jgi:hypothetical protein